MRYVFLLTAMGAFFSVFCGAAALEECYAPLIQACIVHHEYEMLPIIYQINKEEKKVIISLRFYIPEEKDEKRAISTTSDSTKLFRSAISMNKFAEFREKLSHIKSNHSQQILLFLQNLNVDESI